MKPENFGHDSNKDSLHNLREVINKLDWYLNQRLVSQGDKTKAQRLIYEASDYLEHGEYAQGKNFEDLMLNAENLLKELKKAYEQR